MVNLLSRSKGCFVQTCGPRCRWILRQRTACSSLTHARIRVVRVARNGIVFADSAPTADALGRIRTELRPLFIVFFVVFSTLTFGPINPRPEHVTRCLRAFIATALIVFLAVDKSL